MTLHNVINGTHADFDFWFDFWTARRAYGLWSLHNGQRTHRHVLWPYAIFLSQGARVHENFDRTCTRTPPGAAHHPGGRRDRRKRPAAAVRFTAARPSSADRTPASGSSQGYPDYRGYQSYRRWRH